MCGFAGIYPLSLVATREELAARLRAMTASIAHRGPDAENVTVAPFAAVGFRRLAIVDLVTGDQPVSNRAGDVQVFLNGEIYNHLDLRAGLRTEHGIEVDRGSDAAVLPHLYEIHGRDFVDLLNGMFAICVLDARDGSCTLYRDRLGIKPLYFAVRDEAVVFGSELKPLFESGFVEPEIDASQIIPFLELFYVPGPATICRGVEKLLPGERLVLRRDQPPRREVWWRLASPRATRPDDGIEELDALLADATRLQLMADVPVGVSLSGGLDSSLIAHYAKRGDAGVRAFTIAFPSTDPAELACARRVASHLGIEHVEIGAEEGEFLEEIDDATRFNDEPVADPAFFPALRVARAAAAHVKVLLSGTGADELFAGYGHYRLSMRAQAYRLLCAALGDAAAARIVGLRRPPADRAAILAFGRDRLPWHARAMTHLRDADRAALRGMAGNDHLAELGARFAEAAALDPLNRQLCADATTYLPHQLLSLLDRTTMAVSIEGRVPFLDHRVAEFAMSVRGRNKLGGLCPNKRILRRIAARNLPHGIATRAKQGFPSSVPEWLGPSRFDQVRERLLDGAGFAANALPSRWVETLLATPAALRANALTVHSLLVLDSWHHVFVRKGCRRTALPAAKAADVRSA
ncbi:MAG: amidotransferase 1, exosortase A system-associated [Planctomycetota bacterium]